MTEHDNPSADSRSMSDAEERLLSYVADRLQIVAQPKLRLEIARQLQALVPHDRTMLQLIAAARSPKDPATGAD